MLRTRGRPGITERGTGGGVGSSSNLYFTDNAYANGYYTDDAYANAYYNGTPSNVLRYATVQNRSNFAGRGLSTSNRQALYWGMDLRYRRKNLQIKFDNFWLTNTNTEVDNASTVSIISAAIITDTGTVVPLTFSGSRNYTLSSGQADLLSDPLLASAFGLSEIPDKKIWYLKIIYDAGTGGTIPYTNHLVTEIANQQCFEYDSATVTPSTTDAAGQFTFTGAGTEVSQTQGFVPCVLGERIDSVASSPVLIALGNSIDDNNGGGVAEATNLPGGRAHIQRFLYANEMAGCNIARSGANNTLYLNNIKWKNYLKYADDAFVGAPVNDLNTTTGGAIVTTIQTRLRSVYAILKQFGARNIFQGQLMQRISSTTDSYATVAGQTQANGWTAGGNSTTINSNMSLDIGTIKAVIPYPSTRDATVPTKWKVDGTAFYATLDGLHPSILSQGNMALDDAAIISPAISSSPVITGSPTITGTGEGGTSLTATYAPVSGFPAPVNSGQWYLNGVAISGATSLTSPVFLDADIGKIPTFVQTSTNSLGSSNATSANGPTVTDSPLLLANMNWFLDATALNTITAVSTNVSNWNDRGPNGYNAVQPTTARTPRSGVTLVNGNNSMAFNGSKVMMVPTYTGIGTGDKSVYFIMQNAGTGATIRHLVSNGSGFDLRINNAGFSVSMNTAATYTANTGGYPATTNIYGGFRVSSLVTSVFNASSGLTAAAADFTSASGLFIGNTADSGTNGLIGFVGWIVGFDGPHDFARLKAMAATKWGTPP